jgi:hypothetical protein
MHLQGFLPIPFVDIVKFAVRGFRTRRNAPEQPHPEGERVTGEVAAVHR